MTIKVNGQDAVAGCVVDGHWGQYGGVHLLDRASEFVEGMTFAGRTFKPGEWLDVLGEDGFQVIEVI